MYVFESSHLRFTWLGRLFCRSRSFDWQVGVHGRLLSRRYPTRVETMTASLDYVVMALFDHPMTQVLIVEKLYLRVPF